MRVSIEEIKQGMKWWNAKSSEEQQKLSKEHDMRAADMITRHWIAQGRPSGLTDQQANERK